MYYGVGELFEYLQCPDCKTLRLAQVPASLAKYYPENYHCHHVSSQRFHPKQFLINYRNRLFLENKQNRISSWVEKRSHVPSWLPLFKETKTGFTASILDVGCGSGEYLFQLEALGFKNLAGSDPFLPNDIFSVKSKVNFYQKDIYDMRGKYDLVMMHHVFEHMDEPHQVLEQVKHLLKKNGRWMVRIPLVESTAWKTFGVHWYQIDAPRHLYLYSIEGFIQLAKSHGWKVDKVFFDSTPTQFTRSALYAKGITSHAFLNENKGDLSQFFSESELNTFKSDTDDANQNQLGDQACFILTIAN